MSEHNNTHSYLNWAKERMDEMNAVVASLEAKAHTLQADSKTKGDQLIAELKKRRDEFAAAAKKRAEAGEAAWEHTLPQLESQWTAFEAQVKTYFDTVGKQIGQQQATFRDVAAAQAKAWQKAADDFQLSAGKMAAAGRGKVEDAVKQMKADAASAAVRLQKLRHAEHESWSALSAALAESRKAFDKANQKASHAFKRAAD